MSRNSEEPLNGNEPGAVEDLPSLLAQERELERLRALVGPEHWPRIYAMLQRVREEIREAEKAPTSDRSDAA